MDYPGVFDRVKAVVVDGIVLLGLMVAIAAIFSIMQGVPDWLRMTAFVFIFFLYDPLLTTAYGGTLGHRAVGLGVRKEREMQQFLGFGQAVVRFFIKSFLGWISLITVFTNQRRKAIHDFAVGSVVIYRNGEEMD